MEQLTSPLSGPDGGTAGGMQPTNGLGKPILALSLSP